MEEDDNEDAGSGGDDSNNSMDPDAGMMNLKMKAKLYKRQS